MRVVAFVAFIGAAVLVGGCAEFGAAWTPTSPPSATRYVSYSSTTFNNHSLTVVLDTSRFEIDDPKAVGKYLGEGASPNRVLYVMLRSQLPQPIREQTMLGEVNVVGPAARIPSTLSVIGAGGYSHMGMESDYVMFVDSLRQSSGTTYSNIGYLERVLGPPTSSANVSHTVYYRLWDNRNQVLMAEGEVRSSASGMPPLTSGLFSKAFRTLGESLVYEFGLARQK